jgi:putative transposase
MNTTSPLKKLQNNLMLPQVLLEDGPKTEKSDVLDPIMENESTILTILPNTLVLLKQKKNTTLSVMQESVPIIKNKICKDKSNYLKQPTQMLKLSKTLVLDSIGTDLVLEPFWNSSTVDLSRKLWLPIATECVDLPLNSWNGSLKNLMSNSWFSTIVQTSLTISQETYRTTFLQSLLYLLQKTMDSEHLTIKNKEEIQKNKSQLKKVQKQQNLHQQQLLETPEQTQQRLDNTDDYNKREQKRQQDKLKKIKKNKEKCEKLNTIYKEPEPKQQPGKSFKIKVYPDTTQKQTLKKWFGVRRWIYNTCLRKIKNGSVEATIKSLRTHVINNQNFSENNTWMLDYEYDLRDEAVRDLLKNIKSNKEKGKKYTLKYMNKKNNSESLSVLSKKYNKRNNFYSSIFKPIHLKSSEKLPETLNYDSRLIKTRTNNYFLCIPRPLELQSENQAHNNMIFIDPGVRDFLTCYDPSGKIITIGKGDSIRIAKLLSYKRKLQGIITKEKKARKKKRLCIALLRVNEHINHLVKEMHKKTSRWLCKNYDYVFIPRLNFHQCKNLNKRSKSLLSSYQHCAFVDRLIHKSNEFSNCKVIEVNESFTSKTCSCCGTLNKNLGKQKHFTCQNTECLLEIDRDINASRNIMLRYFTKIVKFRFDNETFE